jgi:hypothetical protein
MNPEPKQILAAIDDELGNQAERIFERAKEQMIAELEREKAAIVSRVVIYLSKQIDYQTLSDRVIITVHNKQDGGEDE